MKSKKLKKKAIDIIGSNLKEIILSFVSGVLLFLSFPDQNFYLLEWIAFIPLFFAIKNAGYKKTYFLTLLSGMVFVCLSYTWIPHLCNKFVSIPNPLNYLCWLMYGFYNAQLFCLIFLMFKIFERKTKIPKIITFPFILVTVWSFFPNLFYFTMSHGQSKFLLALQATEYTGTYGLDFIIALSNVTLFILIDRDYSIRNLVCAGISLLITVLWFSYGFFALDSWDNEISSWEKKKIGIIQPNRPSSFTQLLLEKGETIEKPLEFKFYKELSEKKPEFIVWPEGQYRGYLNFKEVHNSYNELIKEKKVPLIFHDLPSFSEKERRIFRNSTILIKDGKFANIYHKRKLVPFGEYIPILNKFYGLSIKLGLPGITAGKKNTIFKIGGMKVQPLICYEIQFSRFVAEAVGNNRGRLLMVQSNDGWYGKGPQSEQHRASNALRAVENRVPMIHVINNGKSSVVMPNGRITFLSKSWKRSSQIVDVSYNINKGGSFFSKHPGLFIWIIRTICLSGGLYLFFHSRNSKKNRRV